MTPPGDAPKIDLDRTAKKWIKVSKLTAEVAEEVRQAAAAGVPEAVIAREVNASRTTVRRWIRK